jgi:hypothetical protein
MQLEKDISTHEYCLNYRLLLMHQHELSVKKKKKKHKKKDLGQTGSTRDYYTMPEV